LRSAAYNRDRLLVTLLGCGLIAVLGLIGCHPHLLDRRDDG